VPVIPRIKSFCQSLFRKEALDRDLEEELRSHLDLLVAEKIRMGMSPEQARREAYLDLGGVEQVKVRVREDRVGAWIDTFLQDSRYAVRTMRRNLGFTIVTVLILAIGIGANTALFSTIDAVLIRAIPFRDPDRLVAGVKTMDGSPSGPVSRVDYFDYRENGRSFQDLAALATGAGQTTVTGSREPAIARVGFATWNLFPTLGVEPVAGRHFLPEEEVRGGAQVVLVSYGFWQGRLGGSPDVIGKSLELDGSPHTVVGVLPSGFRFLYDADLWALIDRDGPFDTRRDSHSHFVVGRLKSGITIEQAQSEVDAIARDLEQRYPDTNKGKGLLLSDLHGFMVYRVQILLWLLMATTALVLLIACGNVAGLLLARGQRRLPEMAMRSALGAPRGRLVRQLLTESLILSLVAGLFGVAVAHGLRGLLLSLLPMGEIGIDPPVIDGRALAFALAVSAATGLIVGLVPALRDTALAPIRHLRAGTRATETVRSARMRNGLVVLQIAVSTVLLVGAGLLIRSLAHMAQVDLGFDPGNLLTGQVQIQANKYPAPADRSRFFTSLVEEVRALPGVVSATAVNKLPIVSRATDWGIWPADQPAPTSPSDWAIYSGMARWVVPGYFKTMRIPLLKGRDISETDVAGSSPVVVVSETVGRALFKDRDPVGRMVRIQFRDGLFEVVGVVGDARLNTLRGGPDAAMYMAAAQMEVTRMQIAVRTTGDPGLLIAPIQRLLSRKDPTVLLGRPAPMTSILDESMGDFRVVTLSLGLFSGVALALAAIGLYGILAYNVSQRATEFGIRMALGASRAGLLAMILRRGLILVGVGLALGVAAAWPGMLLIEQLLFETRPLEASTYLGAGLLLTCVALAACFIPAWRAGRVSPVEVLRGE